MNCSESLVSSKRKVKRKLGTSNRWSHIVPKTCFQGRLRDVLRTSWGRPETISQGRPLGGRLGHPQDVISRYPQDVGLGRPQDVRSRRPRDGQIGSLGDVLWTLEGDVFGTYWGPIFADWVHSSRDCKKMETSRGHIGTCPTRHFVWVRNYLILLSTI